MIDVDVSEVPSFIRGAWSDADVSAALSWAGSAVEAYCERDFSYYANDVVLVDPFPVSRSAQLPNPPVIAVTMLEGYLRDQNGATSWQTLTNYAWTDQGLIYDTTGQPGATIMSVPSWPSLPKSLRVTYTHGFGDVPQPVINAVIKAAGNYLANPFNNTVRKAGEIESAWNKITLQEFGIDELVLAPYRLVTVPR